MQIIMPPDPPVIAELVALRAEVARLRDLEQVVKKGRHAFNDMNKAGKTLIDFFNCWLDQAEDENARLRAKMSFASAIMEKRET